jgi:GGDEF domain-containing protein
MLRNKTKALAIFNLHHFNEVKNTFGHSLASEVLVEMACNFLPKPTLKKSLSIT